MSKLPPSRIPPKPNSWLVFGKRLRALRQAAGFTQRGLKEATGMDFSYLSKVESGKQSPPSMEMLWKVCQALQLSSAETDELFALAGKVAPDVYALLVANPSLSQVVREAAADSEVAANSQTEGDSALL